MHDMQRTRLVAILLALVVLIGITLLIGRDYARVWSPGPGEVESSDDRSELGRSNFEEESPRGGTRLATEVESSHVPGSSVSTTEGRTPGLASSEEIEIAGKAREYFAQGHDTYERTFNWGFGGPPSGAVLRSIFQMQDAEDADGLALLVASETFEEDAQIAVLSDVYLGRLELGFETALRAGPEFYPTGTESPGRTGGEVVQVQVDRAEGKYVYRVRLDDDCQPLFSRMNDLVARRLAKTRSVLEAVTGKAFPIESAEEDLNISPAPDESTRSF